MWWLRQPAPPVWQAADNRHGTVPKLTHPCVCKQSRYTKSRGRDLTPHRHTNHPATTSPRFLHCQTSAEKWLNIVGFHLGYLGSQLNLLKSSQKIANLATLLPHRADVPSSSPHDVAGLHVHSSRHHSSFKAFFVRKIRLWTNLFVNQSSTVFPFHIIMISRISNIAGWLPPPPSPTKKLTWFQLSPFDITVNGGWNDARVPLSSLIRGSSWHH